VAESGGREGKRGRGFRVDTCESFVLDLWLGQTLQQHRDPKWKKGARK